MSKAILLLGGYLLLVLQTPATASPTSPTSLQSKSETLIAQRRQQYVVFIRGGSELLLQQVQRIVPDAFVTSYDGATVIQSGVFNYRDSAEAREKELQAAGIQTTLETVDYWPASNRYRPRQDDDISSNNNDCRCENRSQYFVVILAEESDLPNLEEQVRLLALRDARQDVGVIRKQEPRGWHIRVGPFENRDIADRWNRYLQDFGVENARVYYGK